MMCMIQIMVLQKWPVSKIIQYRSDQSSIVSQTLSFAEVYNIGYWEFDL